MRALVYLSIGKLNICFYQNSICKRHTVVLLQRWGFLFILWFTSIIINIIQ